jgi:hypothetical protein
MQRVDTEGLEKALIVVGVSLWSVIGVGYVIGAIIKLSGN